MKLLIRTIFCHIGLMRIAFFLGLAILSHVSTLCAQTNRHDPMRFESEILRFEASDKTNPPPREAVLLIGSSSIRFWTNAAAQLSGHTIVNRGFGGSHLSDSLFFFDRIVLPYRPKVILLYAGDNDLAAGKLPALLPTEFKYFVAKVHRHFPQTKIGYIAIKPSPSREKLMPKAREVNSAIEAFTKTDERLFYLDIFTPMLDANGKPRGELFVKDNLHLNAAGYELWTEIIKPTLDRVTASSK
jgi:lysophospholipase L1-like esterase